MKLKKLEKQRKYLEDNIARFEKAIQDKLSSKSNGDAELDVSACYRKIDEWRKELDSLPKLV